MASAENAGSRRCSKSSSMTYTLATFAAFPPRTAELPATPTVCRTPGMPRATRSTAAAAFSVAVRDDPSRSCTFTSR